MSNEQTVAVAAKASDSLNDYIRIMKRAQQDSDLIVMGERLDALLHRMKQDAAYFESVQRPNRVRTMGEWHDIAIAGARMERLSRRPLDELLAQDENGAATPER